MTPNADYAGHPDDAIPLLVVDICDGLDPQHCDASSTGGLCDTCGLSQEDEDRSTAHAYWRHNGFESCPDCGAWIALSPNGSYGTADP
jgi:hypothetical protein